MLTPLELPETVAKRRLRRPQRLWHDATQNTSLLGCINCPERGVCGGLNIAASRFSCLDHCCGHPESCDAVCRNNPDYVDRVREIVGMVVKTHRHDHTPSDIRTAPCFAAAGREFTAQLKVSVVHGSLSGAHARSSL